MRAKKFLLHMSGCFGGHPWWNSLPLKEPVKGTTPRYAKLSFRPKPESFGKLQQEKDADLWHTVLLLSRKSQCDFSCDQSTLRTSLVLVNDVLCRPLLIWKHWSFHQGAPATFHHFKRSSMGFAIFLQAFCYFMCFGGEVMQSTCFMFWFYFAGTL